MMRKLILTAALVSAISMPVLAQSTPTPAPAPPVSIAKVEPADESLVLTAEQAKTWINKPVYSSDGNNVGEVAAVGRSTDDKVLEMHADIGGFLGMGETRVKLTPEQFKLSGDRVTINMTAAQAKTLPRVK